MGSECSYHRAILAPQAGLKEIRRGPTSFLVFETHSAVQFEETVILSYLDGLISVISPLFHDAFIKKWICKLLDIITVKTGI